GDGWEIECAQLDMALQVRGVSSEKFLICTWNFELQPNEKCKRTLMLAAYSDEAFFTAKSYPYRFKYTEWFKSIRDVLDYARSDEMRIRRRVKIFEATWLDASFPESLKRLSSFAFHNWVANTLWLIPASDVASERGIEANPPFAEWFSVLEGGGGFYNSTVDVEYNFAPFYLLYYPELLRMVLREWIAYREPGLIRHDMGAGFIANGMSYYHDMPVEENTNYLLLLFALWATSGDNSLLNQHWDVVREVVAYLTNTDTDGNGFPNDGTSNTIDQGSWVVQHAPEQVYLANKMAAAYQAVELMSRVKGDAELADVCRRHRVVINATMHRNAWLGDHYAVCLDRSVIGWDSYSIYAGNGWLYPFMMGIAPDADLVKLRFDIVNSTKRTWRTFGSTHTNRESNLWISQNIWRDCIAAYLGVDMLDHVDAYWNLQHRLNRSLGGAFVDSYNCEDGWGSLTYYPRGLTCTAYFFAISRMHFNRATHRVSFQPLRLPLRIPLLQLADWERERIPWVEFERAGERITIKCTEPDLVRGWEIKVRDPIIAQ
ncbi:MAG TPA: DUF4965 domain-containing protein, partial [Armatimonadetes bacterium]|nr:DUF4965 domain-containing protein [Armatimonadota bacterium]